MRKLMLSAAVCVAMVGAALAQVEASSSVYFLDVDTARYSSPAGERLMLRVNDEPRHVTIGSHDEICVQLQRVDGAGEIISARIRAMGPESKAAEVRVVAPDISPGTYRSTPWGMLLRALPDKSGRDLKTTALGTANAPVCKI